MTGDAVDIAAEETDSDGSSSEYETGSESEESDEGSEERASSSKPVAHSQTISIPHSARPPHRPHRHHDSTEEGRPRQRSVSLRSSRSMTFSQHGRPSSRQDLPPVPPLPKMPMSAVLTKPLPPSPGPSMPRKHSSTDNLPKATQQHRRGPSSVRPRKGKGKSRNPPQSLKPPELHHIPTLLPVFIEMVSRVPPPSLPRPNFFCR